VNHCSAPQAVPTARPPLDPDQVGLRPLPAGRPARLLVEVRDGGVDHGPWVPGVGLVSMAERAAEVGGELTFGSGVVRGVLPR